MFELLLFFVGNGALSPSHILRNGSNFESALLNSFCLPQGSVSTPISRVLCARTTRRLPKKEHEKVLLFPAQADAILRNERRRGTACGLMKKKKVKTSIFPFFRSSWHEDASTILSHSPRRQKLRTNYAPSFPAPPALIFFPELLNWILVGGIRKMTEAMTPPSRYRSHRIPPLRERAKNTAPFLRFPHLNKLPISFAPISGETTVEEGFLAKQGKDNSKDLNRMQENKYEDF